MKLTKQIKAALAKAYQCAMEISILDMKAPLRYINQYIAENVSGFGTAADEKVKSREDYRKMLMKSRQQAKGMLFKAKIITPYRPKFIDETTAQFHDEIVVQIGDKKNKHSIHLYMSCVYKYQFNKWQLVLFHGSMPDAESTTDDTFHLGEAEKKMKELELVVAQRTADLQTKTRELEIEASLERVRAVTMGMNKPGDILNICKIFFSELQSLGFNHLRNTLINFWDDENDLLHDYDYSDFAGGNFAKLPYSSHPTFSAFQKKIRKAKDAFAKLVINKDGLRSWQQRRRNSGEYNDPRLNKISALYYYFYSTGVGALGISTFSPISKDEVEVLKKFRNVFDMAYQRYVDIEKAEAQTRAAQIELAVERVRAKALAMHNSGQILEVVNTLKNEMLGLEISGVSAATIYLQESDGDIRMWDLTSIKKDEDGFHLSLDIKFKLEASSPQFYLRQIIGGKKKYFVVKQDKKSIALSFKWLRLYNPQEADAAESFLKENPIQYLYHPTVTLNNGKMSLDMIDTEPEAEIESIMLKMGASFDLAYKRFLDLQQSETRTKEAQIELSLERVRARSLAMHSTTELQEVIDVVHKELLNLNIAISGGSFIAINSQIEKELRCWGSGGTADTSTEVHIPLYEKPFCTNLINRIKKGPGFFTEEYSQEEKKEFFTFLFQHEPWSKVNAEKKKETLYSPGGYTRSCSVSKHTSIFIINHFGERFSIADNDTLQRFGKVFEQAYTRFLDLQKAEAQAKEAHIESALEKVRSRSMAMHKSEELKEVIQVVYEQFIQLNIDIEHTGFILDYKVRDDMHIWLADKYATPFEIAIPYFDSPHWNSFIKAKKKGENFFGNLLNFEEKNKFYQDLFGLIPPLPEEAKQTIFSKPGLAISTVLLDNVGLYIENFSGTPFTEEENTTLMRFGKVFEQAYTRFLDLQKAEAQTRAAQIELAVERVRAKALAMHSSTQILDVVVTLRNEMLGLNIPGVVAATIYLQEEDDYIRMWDLSSVLEMKDGFQVTLDVKFKLRETDPGLYMRRVWNNSQNYFVEKQEAADMAITLDWLRRYYPEQADEAQQFFNTTEWKYLLHPTVKLAHGKMSVDILDAQPPSEMEAILVKMGAAFDLAYKRFLDLQQSEKQIKEAQIELALERVRARSLAMHKSEELADLSQELVKQVQALGVPTWFCAFNIYDDDPQGSWEWGSSGVITYPKFRTPREHVFLKYYEAGQKGETFLINTIDEDECPAHYEYLCTLPGIGDQLLEMKAAGIPFPAFQIDHVAFMKYGYVLFITYEPMPEAHDIFIRFAKVFEQTYTRFLDLQKAEALAIRAGQDLLAIKEAKQKAEEALTELQVTQKQLVQSEKMASLGELTAGIAHEIQNPLNFVNNFSEVSKELLDEMREAIDKGEIEEAREIMNDVIQNLEKINHHGKRADGIVKGMLQHSSSGSGKKEPIDINVLADEYLRLAYHGLRAKDKSFNATLMTDYDESIGAVSLIPQDIGRVILNLITNAFYAVAEKKKFGIDEYEPAVSISTKKGTDKIEMKVKDNGNGIPQNIIDKIFQPFFTTKPTGQGTGLGLSLAYDIVKAHEGELKVETKEGEGSVFVICLPV